MKIEEIYTKNAVMTPEEIERKLKTGDPDVPEALIVSEMMLEIVEKDNSQTMTELSKKLKEFIATLNSLKNGIILSSIGELFLRDITLNAGSIENIQLCREVMKERGKRFMERIRKARSKIAKLCHPFVLDGSTILTHSHSRVVVEVLREAARAKKHFQVYVTESSPDRSGNIMKKILDKEGIPCTLVLDAAVGYLMEKVSMVLVGAESVVESGGIINKIGSYQIAICAREFNKPFYVLAESFKFARLYPLNQQDLANQLKGFSCSDADEDQGRPTKDYTPPGYITLLFTDLDILTPSAVSDELIKIYT